MELSVLVPAFNEEGNIFPLYNELKEALKGYTYEIIFIDDGSTDNTLKILKSLAEKDKRVKYISFIKNFGKTQALAAGVNHSKGNYIVTLDADLQDPPEEIPRLIKKLEEKNYDCVSGWRKCRKDKLEKKIFSRIFFLLRKIVFKDKIHDANCMLKIYRRDCFKNFDFYGDVHRFVTTILQLKGFKVGELIVKHRKRHSGKTKYGPARLTKGVLDLIFIKFWYNFSSRPLHFFGNLAFIQYGLAFLILIEQIFKKIILDRMEAGPLLLLLVLLFLNGTITFFFGFIAEMIIRGNSEKTNYEIKEKSV